MVIVDEDYSIICIWFLRNPQTLNPFFPQTDCTFQFFSLVLNSN